MTETDFKNRIVSALKSQGALTFKVHGHAFQSSGWPDLYVAHRKWTGWLELKVGSRALTTLQTIILRKLSDRGVSALELRFEDMNDADFQDVIGFLAEKASANEGKP
jgi:hypothetical protein